MTRPRHEGVQLAPVREFRRMANSTRHGGRLTRRKSAPARSPAPARSSKAPVLPTLRAPRWLTPVRQRELVGALLVALAVVTALAFAGAGGGLTRPWLAGLRWALGWAAVLSPLAVGALGAWLILDSMDGKADVRWERPLGVVVLVLALVGLLHLSADLARADRTARDLAEVGAGGGWIGYAVANALILNLGTAPALAVLVLVAFVGASLAAGRTLRDTATGAATAVRAALAALWLHRPALSRTGRRRAVAPLAAAPTGGSSPPSVAPATGKPAAPGTAASRPTAAVAGAAAGPGQAPHTAWQLPRPDVVLEAPSNEDAPVSDDAEAIGRAIEHSLAEFGIPAKIIRIERGPTVTLFGLEPGYVEKAGQRSRVKVSRIVALQNDLALALSASPIRIQAPVPGRPYVGVEVPNTAKTLVSLRGVLESEPFAQTAAKGALPIVLGRDTSGRPVAADLGAMPHLLVAGATGSGKSVAINAIICSLLMTHTPDTLRLVLVDPKRVELAQYRGLPHLATPVVVDIEHVIGVLQWAVREMDRRYKAFAAVGSRNLDLYNQRMVERGEAVLPFLVIIIDELADLMMVAPEEAERLITRLAQLARATGIHLVLATQRPSVDVVTGLIKANFPSRIAFAVSSSIDSRVILDGVGAEKLLGRGDMLYMASDSSKLRRMQGCFVADPEIDRLVRYWKDAAALSRPASADTRLTLGLPESMVQRELFDPAQAPAADGARRDSLFEQAVGVIREHHTASTSFLQRKLRIGYARAARLLDELEDAGYVSPAEGNQPREVLTPRPSDEPARTAGDDDDDAPPPDVPQHRDDAPPERPIRPWLG
jgi:DNA segregation ATPase FtsK/SpoIIIE, S-DNA-T family